MDMFCIIKFLTLHVPAIANFNAHNSRLFMQINILEAVIADIADSHVANAVLGIYLMLLLPIMLEVNLLDCEGFKLWCVGYFVGMFDFV